MVKKWMVPKVELSSFKHDNFDDHIIIGSDKETENSSTVSRLVNSNIFVTKANLRSLVDYPTLIGYLYIELYLNALSMSKL